MPVRPRFDPAADYSAARAFTFKGRDYAPGADFPHADDDVPVRLISRQYDARAICMTALFVGSKPKPAPLVTVEPQPGGYYLIAAPWLEQPVRVRGKAKASAEEERIVAQGEPLSYGGVEVEGADEEWTVKSAWRDEAETLQSEDAARVRAREIRKEGPPDGWVAPQT